MGNELLEWILPQGMLTHFDIDRVEQGLNPGPGHPLLRGYMRIHLSQKNVLPPGYPPEEYESKGFTEPHSVADFPIRGKAVHLVIRRRRWRSRLDKNKVIQTDFSFLADGTRMTAELAAFLKGTGRIPSGDDQNDRRS